MHEVPAPGRRRGARALLWIAVAGALAIAMLGSTSGAALGVVGTTLHQTPPIASSNGAFAGDDEECAGVGAGQVLWHFVLVQTAATSGTISVSFQNAGSFSVPSTKKTGKTLHFDVWTGSPDTLLGASTDAVGKLLNLSHICAGMETTTTTTTTETTTETTTDSSSTETTT